MNKIVMMIITLISVIFIQTLVFVVPYSLISIYFSVIKPMLWIILFLFVYFLTDKRENISKDKSNVLLISVLGIIIYFFALFIGGFVLKFSANPMNTSFSGILMNLWTYVPIIIFREYLRSKMMTSTTKRSKYIILVIVTIVFTYSCMDNIKSVIEFSLGGQADYIMTSFLPLLMLNLFLTYTAMNGAMLSNMIFMFAYMGLPLFSPVLPNIPKIFDAIITYAVIFIMFIIYDKMSHDKKKKQGLDIPNYHWKWMLFPGVVLTICILLGIGAFPFVPVAVASNSMKGDFERGDVVLVTKITKEEKEKLEVGQVIQYKHSQITIAHRIIEITTNAQGDTLYVTKGDANDAIDVFPVRTDQVIGIIEHKIKYLGWPALLFEWLK